MSLDKRLQNPKRSLLDPTESNARVAAIEARLAAVEKVLEDSKKAIHLETDRRDWVGGA